MFLTLYTYCNCNFGLLIVLIGTGVSESDHVSTATYLVEVTQAEGLTMCNAQFFLLVRFGLLGL